MSDVSGLENINELYENSLIKKWIKLIPKEKTIEFDKYTRKDNFIQIADVVLDDEVFSSGKRQEKRKERR